jgi:RNA polymerase sigma-70 factor, ECF subfamily
MKLMAGTSKHELERLYLDRYAHFVRVAAAIAGDEDRAVDVVQEAFAAALRARRSFRGQGPVEAWVWRIVVNTAKKSRRPPEELPVDQMASSDNGPDPTPVRRAIAGLPERQRLVLFLRYYADLDYRAIADALEIAPGTVAATLHAAHSSLHSALEEARP